MGPPIDRSECPERLEPSGAQACLVDLTTLEPNPLRPTFVPVVGMPDPHSLDHVAASPRQPAALDNSGRSAAGLAAPDQAPPNALRVEQLEHEPAPRTQQAPRFLQRPLVLGGRPITQALEQQQGEIEGAADAGAPTAVRAHESTSLRIRAAPGRRQTFPGQVQAERKSSAPDQRLHVPASTTGEIDHPLGSGPEFRPVQQGGHFALRLGGSPVGVH